MRRRDYLVAGATMAGFAGCLSLQAPSGTEDPDEPTPADPDEDEEVNTPEENGNTGDEENGATSDPDERRGPVGFVPDGAIHQWPFLDRVGRAVEDVIGEADGIATAGMESVRGTWRGGRAEYAPKGGHEYIELGPLESINAAASERSLTILATINPSMITPDRTMSIIGAGGGGSNWVELRLNKSRGGFSGHPMILIRDERANTISAVAGRAVEPGSRHRLGVQLRGDSAKDIHYWIDGERVDTLVIDDDELEADVNPELPYGIFASNAGAEGSFRTRRWFYGAIDNVVICDGSVSSAEIDLDFRNQTWS